MGIEKRNSVNKHVEQVDQNADLVDLQTQTNDLLMQVLDL